MRFIYSAATLFILLMTFVMVWYAFAPQVRLPSLAAVIIGGLLGMASIVIGHWFARNDSR